MGEETRKLLIGLLTDHLEMAAYLDGYLTGINDVGWICRQNIVKNGNRYLFRVDVLDPGVSFNYMPVEEIERDLNDVLKRCLESYADRPPQITDYKIRVKELKHDVARNT